MLEVRLDYSDHMMLCYWTWGSDWVTTTGPPTMMCRKVLARSPWSSATSGNLQQPMRGLQGWILQSSPDCRLVPVLSPLSLLWKRVGHSGSRESDLSQTQAAAFYTEKPRPLARPGLRPFSSSRIGKGKKKSQGSPAPLDGELQVMWQAPSVTHPCLSFLFRGATCELSLQSPQLSPWRRLSGCQQFCH